MLLLDRYIHKYPRVQRGRSELIPLQDLGEVYTIFQEKESEYILEEEYNPLLK
jgi:hypothetical protein